MAISKLVGRKVKLVLPSTELCTHITECDKHLVGDVLVVKRIDNEIMTQFNVVCRSSTGENFLDRYAVIQLRYLNNKPVIL